MTDPQILFNIAIALVAFLGGRLLSGINDSIKALHASDQHLTNKLQSIEVLVAGTYIKREEWEKMSSLLFSKLDQIAAKLDTKLDKDACSEIRRRQQP